jgi:uncharacterized membrane protein
MFNRKAYKEIALKELKGRWTTPILTTLFVMIIYYVLQLPNSINTWKQLFSTNFAHFDYSSFSNNLSHLEKLNSNLTNTSWANGTFLPIFIIFISGILTIAQSYLYIVYSHTTEQQPFSVFIKGFSLWVKGFLGILWYILWASLWGLLFFIPGIVKMFSYSQMFFILAEYPNMGVRKAMQISKTITKGYKGDLFVMALWKSQY